MKIFLFGPSGAGKTTIGKKLSKQFNIPFFELDKIFWNFQNNKSITNIQQRTTLIKELLQNNQNRIIEWLYRQNRLDSIIKKADQIYIIQPNRLLIDIRIIYRTIKRMIWIEKSERKSSRALLFNFIKNNHNWQFAKIHLVEFQKRIKKLSYSGKIIKKS